jgi:hypothetical protein
VTGYGLDGLGSIPGKGKIFFYTTSTRLALELVQPSVLWVGTGTISMGIKWLGSEANRSLSSVAEVKNGVALPTLSHSSSWSGT